MRISEGAEEDTLTEITILKAKIGIIENITASKKSDEELKNYSDHLEEQIEERTKKLEEQKK